MTGSPFPSPFRRLLLVAILFPALCMGRTWTSSSGQSIEANLLDYDDATGSVKILRSDGREFTFPLNRLSDADQEFLAAIVREREAEIAAVRAKAGTSESHSSGGEHGVTYHVNYPASFDPDNKPPLLILFSPGGKGKGILNAFAKAADASGFVAVGCDGFKNNMDEDQGNRMFEEVLPHIESTVIHDPGQLYIGGMSGGAARAYHYTFLFDRPWKGVAACGGWLGGADYMDEKYPKRMAVAIINGDKDKNANAWVEGDTEALERRRCEVKNFPFPGGHVVGPPEVLTRALAWMREESTR